MTNKQKIYFIIFERRVVCLQDLKDITGWKQYTILQAVALLITSGKIKVLKRDNERFFTIKDKPL